MGTPEILLGLAGILTLADHATTNLALKHKGTEMNPLLAKVYARWGSTGLFLSKIVAFAAIILIHFQWERLSTTAVAIICLVFAGATAWNLLQLRKAKVI